MWRFLTQAFRSAPQKHFIDRGRVFCTLRGRDVDADLCAGCRWVVELRENGAPPYVTCRPGPEALRPLARQSE